MSVATRISCSRRSRSAASAACSRTSWATRMAGAAWAARVVRRRRSSVEYSCSDSRGPRLRVPISSPCETSGTTSATPASRSAGTAGESSSRRASSTGPGRRLEVGEERVGLGDVDRDRIRARAAADIAALGRRGVASGTLSPPRWARPRPAHSPRAKRRRIGRVSSLISSLMLRLGRPGIVTVSSDARHLVTLGRGRP